MRGKCNERWRLLSEWGGVMGAHWKKGQICLFFSKKGQICLYKGSDLSFSGKKGSDLSFSQKNISRSD